MKDERVELPSEFTLDFGNWARLYPIDSISEKSLVETGNVGILVLWEQIRRKHLDTLRIATQPSDVFAIALGEPNRRDVTKVGGLPYRPRNTPWPIAAGVPMTFLAQFRFVESNDYLNVLPGDILLVFVKNDSLDFFHNDPSYFYFEWQRLGLTDLVEKHHQEWVFITCYGVRHRTVDYIDTERCLPSLREALCEYFPETEPDIIERRIWTVLRFGGRLKIGGIPLEGNAWGHTHSELRYLGTLPTILPRLGSSYRWINCPESSVLCFPYPREETLEWPQEGAWINLFLDNSGQVLPKCESFV